VTRGDRPGTGEEEAARGDLPAGGFSSWLLQLGRADDEGGGAVVPCGACTACCTSSQFIHIGPGEAETLARIPPGLLFPAPGRPKGHVLMGYDEKGHCPMFVGGSCSIYGDRPRTCRAYDCRVLPAAGLEPDDDAKAAITDQVRRWRFAYPTALDRSRQAAVAAAATFLRTNATYLPVGLVPRNPTQLAFLAVRVHEVFLGGEPSVEVVEAAVRRAGAGRPG